MHLYFKTKKESETGSKFHELEERGLACGEAVKQFLDKYHFQCYRPSRISFVGGISACCSPTQIVDRALWKETGTGPEEYMPRLNIKKGKAIMEEIKVLPIVDIDELNKVVGYPGNGFKSSTIGFSGRAACKSHYGFIILDTWNVKVPNDCEEITASEYKKMFLKEK